MISRIHSKLGTAGFIISIVALVAALGGGAYAANSALSGKQKKEVEKIAKKYAGKPGATGAAGPAGPAGAKGDAGAAGAKGDTGAKGETGAPGANGVGTPGASGESVELVESNPASCGSPGGVVYEVGGTPTPICNGSPWTVGGLPKGATEEGAWTLTAATQTVTTEVEGVKEEVEVGDTGIVKVPISFNVPLAAKVQAANVHVVPSTGEGECNGTYINPLAPAGVLCIYVSNVTNATLAEVTAPNAEEGGGTTKAGAVLKFTDIEGVASGVGVWAVGGGTFGS